MGTRPQDFASPRLPRKTAAARGLLGLALVEPLLEELTQLFAGRQQVFVARSARGQRHDPDVARARSVAARVRGGLVKRRKRGTAAEKSHGVRSTRLPPRRETEPVQFAPETDR